MEILVEGHAHVQSMPEESIQMLSEKTKSISERMETLAYIHALIGGRSYHIETRGINMEKGSQGYTGSHSIKNRENHFSKKEVPLGLMLFDTDVSD